MGEGEKGKLRKRSEAWGENTAKNGLLAISLSGNFVDFSSLALDLLGQDLSLDVKAILTPCRCGLGFLSAFFLILS